MPASPAGFARLRVAQVEQLTANSVAVTFEVPPALREGFVFRAGQHLTLRRVVDGDDVRRTYSVCSPVGGPLRVAVKRRGGGVVSSWLTTGLQPGDEVEVLPPAGRFGPDPDPSRARCYGLVAAGSGITPVLSIAASVLAVEPASEVVLVYANRTSADVMFLDELADLKDRFPQRLQLLHVLSGEQQAAELLSGRLDRDRLQRLFATLVSPADVDEWYLCGPLGLVTDTRQVLLGAGVPAEQVHVELFHADPPPPRPPAPPVAAAGSTVTVLLNGRSTTVTVDPGGDPILDRVLAARPDAPYACRGGVCGTCRARVVDGAVTMDRNYALEPDELAAGVVLTCQAHPVTGTVRLEYL